MTPDDLALIVAAQERATRLECELAAAREDNAIRPERAARLLTPASWTLAGLLAERDYLVDCGAPTDADGCYELPVTKTQFLALMGDDAFAAAAREVLGRLRHPDGDFHLCGIAFLRVPPAGRDTR